MLKCATYSLDIKIHHLCSKLTSTDSQLDFWKREGFPGRVFLKSNLIDLLCPELHPPDSVPTDDGAVDLPDKEAHRVLKKVT